MQPVHLCNLPFSLNIAVPSPKHLCFHEKAQILTLLSGLAVYVCSFSSRAGKYLI